MKKVFSALVLTSFLAVLLVPAMASAANCPNWNCQAPVGSVPCICGDATTVENSSHYCWGAGNSGRGKVFTSETACLNAMAGGTTGGTEGSREIPTNVLNTPGELLGLIETIGRWIFTALLAIAVIMLLLAGFHWVTSGGDPLKVKKASDTLKYALIGVAIALGAKGLIAVIESFILK